jgi:hypothetical protein
MNRTVVNPKQEPIRDTLPGLKNQLEKEYEHLPDERIDQVAKHSVERLSGARVSEFVSVLAGGMRGCTYGVLRSLSWRGSSTTTP